MSKRKWFIVAGLLSLLLVGSLTGVALAQSDSEDGSSGPWSAFLGKVCGNYQERNGTAIDQAELEQAMVQARNQMRDEALASRLEQMVEDGRISQEEADAYLEWWQARPDIDLEGFSGRGAGEGMRCGRGGHHVGGSCMGPNGQGEGGAW